MLYELNIKKSLSSRFIGGLYFPRQNKKPAKSYFAENKTLNEMEIDIVGHFQEVVYKMSSVPSIMS